MAAQLPSLLDFLKRDNAVPQYQNLPTAPKPVPQIQKDAHPLDVQPKVGTLIVPPLDILKQQATQKDVATEAPKEEQKTDIFGQVAQSIPSILKGVTDYGNSPEGLRTFAALSSDPWTAGALLNRGEKADQTRQQNQNKQQEIDTALATKYLESGTPEGVEAARGLLSKHGIEIPLGVDIQKPKDEGVYIDKDKKPFQGYIKGNKVYRAETGEQVKDAMKYQPTADIDLYGRKSDISTDAMMRKMLTMLPVDIQKQMQIETLKQGFDVKKEERSKVRSPEYIQTQQGMTSIDEAISLVNKGTHKDVIGRTLGIGDGGKFETAMIPAIRAYVSTISGKTVTDQEAKDYAKAFNPAFYANPSDALYKLNRLKDAIKTAQDLMINPTDTVLKNKAMSDYMDIQGMRSNQASKENQPQIALDGDKAKRLQELRDKKARGTIK